MPLVHMKDMLDHAWRHGYAVGAFDVVGLEFLEAVMAGVEQARAPVIISLAESHFEHYDFELLMAAVEAAARRSPVPTAIHLDHGESLDSAIRAINLGANGVMVDASSLPLAGNIERTRAIVEMARGCDVPVEGELGYVAGVEGEDAERHPGEVIYTSVDEASSYVDATGVDFLAVSIGTVHGRLRSEPRLDFDRLAAINEALGIPLVIHGGTGLSDDQFRRLIANGVAKINYYTALADRAADAIRAQAAADPAAGYTRLLSGTRAAIRDEVLRCCELWGSAGRAAALLEHCRPWTAVEHTILYNVEGLDHKGVEAMMREGHAVLSAIPGVRRVFTGDAVADQAPYRHCWLVRFASAAVIDSYREHPAHRRFADEHFRPHAGNRISIDFAERGSRQAGAHNPPAAPPD